tara:strand:- start:6039 stop:6317 length:279 start_codon:yes stop_codon:yes gene_type:complete
MKEHNKHYWEIGRNGYVSDTTIDSRIPAYYIGKYYKYEARKVVEDFDLSYNCGTAVTYLLRANRKHKSPVDCIKKAIAHLEFELEKIKKCNI